MTKKPLPDWVYPGTAGTGPYIGVIREGWTTKVLWTCKHKHTYRGYDGAYGTGATQCADDAIQKWGTEKGGNMTVKKNTDWNSNIGGAFVVVAGGLVIADGFITRAEADNWIFHATVGEGA